MTGFKILRRRRLAALVPLQLLCLQAALSVPSQAQSTHPEVLIVYSTAALPSKQVADYYAAHRAIPVANECAISPSATDYITLSEYTSTIKPAIQACLNAAGKRSILYIVFSQYTPFAVSTTQNYALDSFVADIWDSYTTKVPFPAPTQTHGYYGDTQSQGEVFAPFVSLASYRTQPRGQLIYSVWRLDSDDTAVAEGLVDKALATEAQGGLQVSLPAQACVDRNRGDITGQFDTGYSQAEWDLFRAAEQMTRTGYSVLTDSNDAEFGTAPAPLRCDNAALYSGWYSLNNYNDAFSWVTGAVGFHLDSASALDPRAGLNWSFNAVKHGLTATSGAVAEPFLEGLPRASGVFRDLFAGASVGDAFLRNTRWIKWNIINIGDPLYRPFPNGLAPYNVPVAENSLALSNRFPVGGVRVTGTVGLSSPAPAGGVTVALASSIPAAASVPANVTIAAGASQAVFPITTYPVTAEPEQDVLISASVGGNPLAANTLAVTPLVSAVTTSTSSVVAGAPLTGTVYLNGYAPASGISVALSSTSPGAVIVPASVTVTGGTSIVQFNISTVAGNSGTVSIFASYGGATVGTTITLTP